MTDGAEAGGGALLPDHRQRHGDPRGGARRAAAAGQDAFDGDVAFKLHDTYGFPLDLTADVCRERGVTVDSAGFEAAMDAAARAGARGRQVQDGAGAGVQRRADHLPRLRAARPRQRQGHSRSTSTAAPVELREGRRRRRRRARPHAVLCRDRAARSATPASCATRPRAFVVEDTHEDPGRGVRPPGPRRRGRDHGRRRARCHGRRRAARQHGAQPQRHPPDAQGAARGAGRARAAEGLAGRRRAGRASTSRTTRR